MTDHQEAAAKKAPTAEPKVEWDDAKLRTSYANVVNAASTREEVTLLFGTNRTWNPAPGSPVRVELTDRIIMSPFAAKRLMLLLSGVLKEYEGRYGKLAGSVPRAASQPSGTETTCNTDANSGSQ